MPIIKVKVNVSKINKEKLFKGKNGTYLDLTLIPNREGEDRFGNSHFVKQDLGKDESGNYIESEIIGNAKTMGQKPAAQPKAAPAKTPAPPADDSSEVPF